MARSRRHGPRRSNVFIGSMAAIFAALLLFFGFTKDVPFTHGFLVKAQFESANSIRPNSPVRIAGVEVGKVKSVEGVEGSNAALLTMELNDSALPLHEDATAKIRPRIFLEGNFFVDLKPGTPSAPKLDSGDTIKISQTASPVQLDEVLTSLQSDSREDLKALLTGLNTALNSEPTAEEDAESSPLARGQTAAESFNDALDDIPAAEQSSAQVFEALLGTEPGRDVARLIRGTANTADELDRYEGELQDLITNLNLTTATFASESTNLRATIRGAEDAIIDDAGYLRALGICADRCSAGDVWRALLDACARDARLAGAWWQPALDAILARGPLARRILRATGERPSRRKLRDVYEVLCDCLRDDRMFG